MASEKHKAEKNMDLRSVKTRRLIKQTFLELIKEKGYQHITVTDIAARALINRKTFYFHYETIEELYVEIADEYIRLLDFSSLFPVPQTERSGFRNDLVAILVKIREQKEPFLILMNDPSNHYFDEKLKHFFSDALTQFPSLEAYAVSQNLPYSLLRNMCSDAFFEIIKWWLEQDNISAIHAVDILLSLLSATMQNALGVYIDTPENKNP